VSKFKKIKIPYPKLHMYIKTIVVGLLNWFTTCIMQWHWISLSGIV